MQADVKEKEKKKEKETAGGMCPEARDQLVARLRRIAARDEVEQRAKKEIEEVTSLLQNLECEEGPRQEGKEKKDKKKYLVKNVWVCCKRRRTD